METFLSKSLPPPTLSAKYVHGWVWGFSNYLSFAPSAKRAGQKKARKASRHPEIQKRMISWWWWGGREIQEFKTSSFNPWTPVLSPASAAAAAAAAPKSNPHLKIFRKKYVLHFKFLFCKPVPTRWATFWSPPPSAPYFYLPPLILQVTKEFETRSFSSSGLLLTKCTKN